MKIDSKSLLALGSGLLAACVFVETSPSDAAKRLRERHPDATSYAAVAGAALAGLGVSVRKPAKLRKYE